MNPIRRLAQVTKAFVLSFANSTRSWWTTMGRSRINYAQDVGTGRGNAALMAVILWFCRTFPEAPIRISTINAKGELTPVDNHPLKRLLDNPNEFYSGELLWHATVADWQLGNAYWLKIRSDRDRPAQLWWIPSSLIEPRWPEDGSEFISHYEYNPNGTPQRIETRDVVHFRYGMDPENPRKGLSPVGALVRELFTDDEAANYTATMLRNVGVPPIVVQPKADKNGNLPKIDEAGAKEVKDSFESATSGDNRGRPVVMRGSTEITTLGFNPLQMDVKALRRIPEERISAIFGTPAVVVGLGAGLDRSTFANFAEAREAAYESNVIPSQRLLAAELRTQLLPDFGDTGKLKLDFDLSKVRVLQDDQNELHTRAREDLARGGITLNEFRAEIGLEPLKGKDGDVLYIPINVTPTPPAELLLAPEPAAPVPLPSGQPAKVFALPSGRERKDAVQDATERLQARLQASADAAVMRFLAAQQQRVLSRLSGGKAVADIPDADVLVTAEEEALLLKVLTVIHLRSLEATHLLVEDALGVTITVDAVQTQAFLTEAGKSVTGITHTTRMAVRAAVDQGLANGETVAEIAQRLEELPEFSAIRAQLVARTEVASALNRAHLLTYRLSGVVAAVRVTDGDQDGGCSAVNGKTFPLDEAPPALEHPNCTRRFSPVMASGVGVAA